MKGFLKVGMVCVGLAGSLQAVAADIEWYYGNFAPSDLASLKGFRKDTLYDGYLSSLKKGLEVVPEINHTRIPHLHEELLGKVDVEYRRWAIKPMTNTRLLESRVQTLQRV